MPTSYVSTADGRVFEINDVISVGSTGAPVTPSTKSAFDAYVASSDAATAIRVADAKAARAASIAADLVDCQTAVAYWRSTGMSDAIIRATFPNLSYCL